MDTNFSKYMKNKSGILIAVSLMASVAAYSQSETDDMYFNSKDRAKTQDVKPQSFARASSRQDDARFNSTPNQASSVINPTDSYSARGENPEYASRANTQNSASDAQYFVPNYQPTGVNQNLLSSNCN